MHGERVRQARDEATQAESGGVTAQFARVATRVSEALGSAWAFLAALLIIVVWGITGPAFRFSDTWQLVINTGTTIVTFLMVFVIQNTQNRDSKATQLKLDELIRAIDSARNRFIGAEDEDEEQLREEKREVEALKDEVEGSSNGDGSARRKPGRRKQAARR